MNTLQSILLTFFVGGSVGFLFLKIKVPGGLMVGAIVGVAVYNVSTGYAIMPISAKVAAQIIAGAFIGVGIEKADIIRLKKMLKPVLFILIGLLILNISMGYLIYLISPLDLITSFMCSIPGGMSNIPIISEEMGADSAKVAVMQFIRMVFGIGVFPIMISKISKMKVFNNKDIEEEIYKRISSESNEVKDLFITIATSIIFGLIGYILKIPSGTLVFSMISVIILKLKTGRAHLPTWVRRIAQVLSGTYIGSGVVYSDIIEIKYLILPAVILIFGYAIACLLLGSLLHKKCNMPLKDSMLACTPAGATDMALIAADIGVESADVIVLQIIRLVIVVGVFPQLIRLLINIL